MGDVNTAKPKPRIAKSIAKIYNGKDSLINKPISRSDAEMIAIPLEAIFPGLCLSDKCPKYAEKAPSSKAENLRLCQLSMDLNL